MRPAHPPRPYATAKAAVIGICKGGARELGPCGITVNVIAPGPIDTEIMGGRLTEERKESRSARIPLGRVGQPEENAAGVPALRRCRLYQRRNHSARRRQAHALNTCALSLSKGINLRYD
jgi:NAD(P)-dependent dehydrogenase (short-subunit alcohol dehydrogenase family)